MEKMNDDLISRNYVIERLKKVDMGDQPFGSLVMAGVNHAIDVVNEAPTVEAEPVVHGHWIGEADGYADGELVYDVWYCSECNFCIDDGTDDPELLPNYCENCGAHMGEEVADD